LKVIITNTTVITMGSYNINLLIVDWILGCPASAPDPWWQGWQVRRRSWWWCELDFQTDGESPVTTIQHSQSQLLIRFIPQPATVT